MKNLKFVSAILVLFTALNFVACSSDLEPIDPAININPNPDPDPDPNPSAGDYWPAAVNNQWIYNANGVTQSPMKMVSMDNIGGNVYYTFNPQSGTGQSGLTGTVTTRLRKQGGSYYIKTDDIVTQPLNGAPGATTTGSENIILKDNIEVGDTWTNSYTQTTTYSDPDYPVIELNYVVVGTILEKGISVTVNGQNYSDVIKTQYVQNVTAFGSTSVTTTYYWFAKDVGMVKSQTASGSQTYTSELQSYTLN